MHGILAEDDEVRAAIRDRWGNEAVGNRSRIGAIVFDDRAELEWLEQLLHPRTRAATEEWLRAQETPLRVVEVPLLYETGGDTRFDAVVVVTAPSELREARRGLFPEREARLIPDDEKLRRADFAYVNDGSLDALDAFVADVVAKLTA